MKANAHILPFHFPTTVAFIDDSQRFLNALGMICESRFPYLLFSSPQTALGEIQSVKRKPSMLRDLFLPYAGDSEIDYSKEVIEVSMDAIGRQTQDETRFEQISVIVVDYSMPYINGVDFCNELRDNPAKKILLTGTADERAAVRAFNDKIIDRFIRKHEINVAETLINSIDELQFDYFMKNGGDLLFEIPSKLKELLIDKSISRMFVEVCASFDIVEHYMVCRPNGFYMVNRTGSRYLLLIATEEELKDHLDIASDAGAPAELLTLLGSREYLPYFNTPSGYYEEGFTDWRRALNPATRIGDGQFRYTIVRNPICCQSRVADSLR